MVNLSGSGNWEWRYFVKLPSVENLQDHLKGVREDLYYIATPHIGLKLRNGDPKLEVKTCHQEFEIFYDNLSKNVSKGKMQLWSKSKFKNCVEENNDLKLDKCLKKIGL